MIGKTSVQYQYADTVIQLFTKAPLKGKVKTRLEPILTQDEIVSLYKNLISDRVKQVIGKSFCPLNVWAALDAKHEFFLDLQNQYPIEIFPQVGIDLGERMHYAVQRGLNQYQKVILLGGDCVSVDLDYLHQAVDALNHQSVVLGPAEDGGYVLLGTRVDCKAMFVEVDWGTDQVLKQTVEKLEQQNLQFCVLDTRWDLDRPEDLVRFQSDSNNINLLG